MAHYNLAIPQLMSNSIKVFLGLIVVANEAGVELAIEDFLALYYPKENENDFGRYLMYPRYKKHIVGGMVNADRYWQDRYFFMLVIKKSMGALANALYPLWSGPLCKSCIYNIESNVEHRAWKMMPFVLCLTF